MLLITAIALDFVEVLLDDVFTRFCFGVAETTIDPRRIREGAHESFWLFVAGEEVGFHVLNDVVDVRTE